MAHINLYYVHARGHPPPYVNIDYGRLRARAHAWLLSSGFQLLNYCGALRVNIEQAIGQKLIVSFAGMTPPEEVVDLLRQQHIGGVTLFRHCNVGAPAEVRVLSAALQRATAEAGISPLLIAADQEGGQLVAIAGTTPFPGNMALGAAGREELAWRAGHVLGLELAAMGVNVNYAPDCDVNVNPANPVTGVRSFGEDAQLVARLAAAMVTGIQAAGVAATAKHFPGHGDAEGDTHHGLVVVPHDNQAANGGATAVCGSNRGGHKAHHDCSCCGASVR